MRTRTFKIYRKALRKQDNNSKIVEDKWKSGTDSCISRHNIRTGWICNGKNVCGTLAGDSDNYFEGWPPFNEFPILLCYITYIPFFYLFYVIFNKIAIPFDWEAEKNAFENMCSEQLRQVPKFLFLRVRLSFQKWQWMVDGVELHAKTSSHHRSLFPF
ncbi:hypothetical protein NQ317_007422 [Molorchus minor]|uniref:Uncharacterized protein n=1 Tax=Molorchus minor TaxID=1323400 RepID=A0ABQ9JGE0_9CUCU|nr:hypothetical protein NQ317_007422 [Molorchus minor]